jgi:hypothetical protein
VTTKEKWEITLGCISIVLVGWFYYAQLDEIGANNGFKHKLTWWREQRRKKEEAERDFFRLLAQTNYEAQCAVEGVEP